MPRWVTFVTGLAVWLVLVAMVLASFRLDLPAEPETGWFLADVVTGLPWVALYVVTALVRRSWLWALLVLVPVVGLAYSFYVLTVRWSRETDSPSDGVPEPREVVAP